MNTLRNCLAAWVISISLLSSLSLFSQSKVMRLDALLDVASETALKAEGIDILHYYGDQTYLLSKAPTSIKAQSVELASSSARLGSEVKSLSGDKVEIELVLAYPDALNELKGVLVQAGFEIAKNQVQDGVSLAGKVSQQQLQLLLGNPLILDASPMMNDVVPYNLEGRIAQSVTPLNSGITGAPGLNGEGVVLGIGDGGKLSGHPDIGDRIIHSTSYYNSGWGSHPDMVAGIMTGAGTIAEDRRGVACEAELVIEPSSSIVYFAPSHLTNYNMSITNNSYGPSFHCATASKYYGVSASVDQQLFDNPKLLHVYAAGNSGTNSCNGNPVGYGTMPGGAQNAKNSLSVGNAVFNRTRYAGSSAGPAFDGRLKPEIMAVGRYVTSNNRAGSYSTGSGTSYSSPGVAATLGLLTQRYKELSGGALPDGALLKAIACNTAEDIGPHGPDFLHGFGLINGVKSLAAINNNNYYQGYLSTGTTFEKIIPSVGGVERIKFLLYWPDQAGPTTNTVATLVNKFSLKVVAPNGDTIRPWVLDPLNPADLATRGTDTLNNIVQVTIDAPTAGDYKLLVEGVDLPYGSTDYVLTWDIQEPEVMVTCPFGGESLTPDEEMYIGWNASPGQTGTWKLEYSLDGDLWQVISQGIAASSRYYVWTPPMSNTAIQFRVTNETSLLSDVTNEPAFLLGVPENVVGESMCDGSVNLTWSPVVGADSYQVFKFDGSEMILESSTTDTSENISGLVVGVDSLFTVQAVSSSGKTSQRAYAISKKSEINEPNCNSPLPVEWLSVEVKSVQDQVLIEWTVASELNNERFEVFKSSTGTDWSLLDQVAGRGTARSNKTYTVVDVEAKLNRTSYYRIRQVDYGGRSDLSDIVAYVGSGSTTLKPTLNLIENPVSEFIRLESMTDVTVNASLYDLTGNSLMDFQVLPGKNLIQWPHSLKSGVYVVQTNLPSGIESLKLVKR